MKRLIFIMTLLCVSLSLFSQTLIGDRLIVRNGGYIRIGDSIASLIYSGTLVNDEFVVNQIDTNSVLHVPDSFRIFINDVLKYKFSDDSLEAQDVDIIARNFISASETTTKTIYVSEGSGSDITGDGSAGTPYQTLDFALNSLRRVFIGADVTVKLDTGTYSINNFYDYKAFGSLLTISGTYDTIESGLSTSPYSGDGNKIVLNGGFSYPEDSLTGYYAAKNASNLYPIFYSDADTVATAFSANAFPVIARLRTRINITSTGAYNFAFEGSGSQSFIEYSNIYLTGRATFQNPTKLTTQYCNIYTDASESIGMQFDGNNLLKQSHIFGMNPTGTAIDVLSNAANTNMMSRTAITGSGTKQGNAIQLRTERWTPFLGVYIRNFQFGYSFTSNGGLAELINTTPYNRFMELTGAFEIYYGADFIRRIDGGNPIVLDDVDYIVYSSSTTFLNNTMIYLPEGMFSGSPNTSATNFDFSIDLGQNFYINVEGFGRIFSYDQDSIFTIGLDSVMYYKDIVINGNIKADTATIGGKQIRYNINEGVPEFETGQSLVMWQGPTEDLIPVYNQTGQTITNGSPVYYVESLGDSIASVALAAASVDSMASRFAGIATQDILTNNWGFITSRGYVRDIPADFTNNILYLGDSILIDTAPPYPNRVVITGVVIKSDPTNGIIYSYPSQEFNYGISSKDYNFTSQGIGNGVFYRAGFYQAPVSSVTLTQASTTQTYGTANTLYSAHPFIVCGGAGTVDAGVIGLRVTGTSINDLGVETAADADTILYDITAVSTDEYYEAKKFVGTVIYELITISGSPTTYSFSFNYGYAKYDDINNRDFFISGIECIGLAAANDAGFDLELLKHQETGWTYSAGAFAPGSTPIVKLTDDITTDNNLSNGLPFTYKRSNLDEFIQGSGIEGYLIRITTSTNNSIQSLDMHVEIAIQN